MVEIYAVFVETSGFPPVPIFFIMQALYDLWANDEILCDKELNRMSVNPFLQKTPDNESEYELFSDRFERMYAHKFVLNERLAFRPGPDTPVLNFKYVKELLLSTDLSRNAELDWIKDGSFRFLDAEDMTGNQVAFSSYPRTGNSFMRRFLEQITGIYTGSDMRVELTKNAQFIGLDGEGTVASDNLVWVTKTHYPFESPFGASEFST